MTNQKVLQNLLKSGRRVPPVIIDGGTECRSCHEWKPLPEFPKNSSSPTGISAICRKCKSDNEKRKIGSSIEASAQSLANRYRQSHRGRSARRKDMASDSSVTAEMIVSMWHEQDGRCAVTGIKMTHIFGSGFGVMTNVSVDRINNDQGYHPGNVRLVCKAVNYMKHTMTDAELVEWCRAVIDGPLFGTKTPIEIQDSFRPVVGKN